MNKDKIIKDLKERNDKLENQRRQFEIRLYHEQHLVEEKDKEIERLNRECDTYLKIATKRKNRIDKATEYLEQPYRDNFDYSKAELLNILNGSDDNER